MEVNENTVLQNGKVEDEYVRIGTTLFRILNQPMMNGSFRKMRVEWKMSVFRQDHSKDEAAQIPKYDGFCTMPSHTDYRHNVNNFYNLYEPITHIPAEGDFQHICSLVEHIFGEQYELGMDYLQLLYLKPTQKLPILLLVSEERNTGKSTFLNFLKAMFQENVTWREMDLSAYESEQKQREQLAAKVRELQEKNTELQKAATNYYLYTAEGERLFCERHNCRIYPDNRGIYWHFKVTDYPAYTFPTEISRAYLNHEISIRDVYVYWRKNY